MQKQLSKSGWQNRPAAADAATEQAAPTQNVSEETMATGSETAAADKQLQTDPVPAEETEAPAPPFATALMVILLLAVSILMIWFSSRFRFIWFDAIVTNDAAIRNPFSKYRAAGHSLFKAWLIGAFVIILGITLAALVITFILSRSGVLGPDFDWTGWKAVVFGVLPVLLAIVAISAAAVFLVLLDDFVVTIMALESSGFLAAWKQFVQLFKENTRDFVRYIFVKFGLGVAAWIFQVVLIAGWFIAVLLAGFILLGIPYVFFVVLLKAEMLFTLFSILLGVPFFIVALLVLLTLGLPTAVFFRSFSLYFLSSLKTSYTPLPLE